jgi:sulfatase modifying factor 1
MPIRALLALSLLLVAAPAASAQEPRSFRDCDACPAMVTIPAGRFVMGMTPDEDKQAKGLRENWRKMAEPQHEVAFATPFAIGKYEVTRREFAAFVEATGHQPEKSCYVYAFNSERKRWRYSDEKGKSWRDPGFQQGDDHPVICVNWDDAKAYAAWLAKKTGKPYRLPSEAEWEYAARAGTTAPTPWNDDPKQACRHANAGDRAAAEKLNWNKSLEDGSIFDCADGYAQTAPVGKFKANAFGLHDMLGNVFEWTEDCYNPNYQGAPADGSAWTTGLCERRIDRGGSWSKLDSMTRFAFRDVSAPFLRSDGVGFRVALGL